MIRLRRAGEVTQLAMARTVLGRPLYVACAYYVDGLLLDNGPPVTQGELAPLLAQMEVRHARGMIPRRIRLDLLGRETWWPVFTTGHFSKQHLIDALLRDERAA